MAGGKNWLGENYYTQMVRITLNHRFGDGFEVGSYIDIGKDEVVLAIYVPMKDGSQFIVREHHPRYYEAENREVKFLTDETLAAIMLLVG